ncbi:MAG TPA: GTP 3',8-cyclase MoaA [Rhodocyclaceae bacterium]
MELDAISQTRSRCLSDVFGRDISYLRLSVTDRCNLRCFYCMRSDASFLPRAEVLSLEELERLCAVFAQLGVKKIRLTGGEPLARPGIMGLIARLGRRLKAGEFEELTLTTNGSLLAEQADALAAAGMRRINVSLDTLDEGKFQRITGHGGLDQVIAGIEAARAAGLAVRINTVALKGVNDDEFDDLIAWSGERGCDMALIELMPLGGVQPGADNYLALDAVRRTLARRWTLAPAEASGSGPASYLRIAETGRRLGFITPMSHRFCLRCNRVRLTCAGQLVLCLAREGGIDLRHPLRQGADDAAIADIIAAGVALKPLEHQFGRNYGPAAETRMWQVGG